MKQQATKSKCDTCFHKRECWAIQFKLPYADDHCVRKQIHPSHPVNPAPKSGLQFLPNESPEMWGKELKRFLTTHSN